MFEQIAMDNASAIVRLIGGGVPVDSVDDSKNADSTLHWASSFGSVLVAVALLSHGCNVNITNAEGQTPLHLACKGKHRSLIDLLLQEGASTAAKDLNGNTPRDLLLLTRSSSPTPVSGGASPVSDPAQIVAEIEALLLSPPEPTKKLRGIFEKAQEALAAEKQLLLQQKLLAEAHLAAVANPVLLSEGVATAATGNGEIALLDSCDDDWAAEHNENEGKNEKDLLLIFWPPVKKQVQKVNATPLILRNNANLLISVASSEIDIFPLLTWSGLMDAMDSLGFQVQVKRSSSGARIRLCIDAHICPVRNSYELKVTKDQIYLTAGDGTGLLYGVYTLIQLLKLHSDVRQDVASGVTSLIIPAIAISDRPDVAQRAVLWSYRQQVRAASTRMQEQIELLSRLRINTLFLVIDEPSATSADGNALGEFLRLAAAALIEVVPSVVVASIHQR